MMQRGYQAAMAILGRTRDSTALMAFNDGSAIGAIRAIQDCGLKVPADISVVGADDIKFAEFVSPRLTTIRKPLKPMGAIAASTLLQRIRDENVPKENPHSTRACNTRVHGHSPALTTVLAARFHCSPQSSSVSPRRRLLSPFR